MATLQATTISGNTAVTSGNIGTYAVTPSNVATYATLIPSGTVSLFVQTSAPTGWTKSTSHDNKALRVVSGTAGSGGSTAFTSVFASRTPTGSVSVSVSGGGISATTLSTNQLASHAHTYTYHGGSGGHWNYDGQMDGPSGTGYDTSSTGSNATHTHGYTSPSGSGSFSGSAMDFAVQYVDTIIATKN